MTPRQQAMKDMTEVNISIQFLLQEQDILFFTATINSKKPDFRKFNGGHNKKQHKLKHPKQ
jgi:hypothetical protein